MKKYYLIFSISMLLFSCTWKTKTGSELPVVGAIRWDGWSGCPAEVNYILHRTLAPQEFHDRIPFFGKSYLLIQFRLQILRNR